VGFDSQPCHQKPGAQTTAKEALVQKAQKWRTGCEGRISVLKRRHGLQRSRYKGPDGMKRWVGFGVIADNIIHIGSYMAAHPSN
jgi:IS5 family transposase